MNIIRNINLFSVNPGYGCGNDIPKTKFWVNVPIKSDSVCFCAKEPDLTTKSAAEILQDVEKSIKKENFMGEGFEAVVYRILNSKYCARIDNEMDLGKLSSYKNLSKLKITDQDKVNHVVTKLGSQISIMPIIPGEPVITYDMPIARRKLIAQKIAEFPKETFHKFMKQICNAYDKGMVFDCSWANVIVNSKAKKLTAIDFNRSDEALNVMNSMFVSLVHEHTTPEQMKNYAGKILYSVAEELKPGNKPCFILGNLDTYRFVHMLGDKKLIENPKYVDLLLKTFDDIKELKYGEIRGECVESLLNGKLNVLKAIIKQLFKVV